MSTLNQLARSARASRANPSLPMFALVAPAADAPQAAAPQHANVPHPSAPQHANAPLPSAPPLPVLPPPSTAAPTVIHRRPRWSMVLTALVAGCALWFLQPRRALAGPKATPASTDAASPAADPDDTSARGGKKTPTGKLNLNTATVDQLMLLPGIGPSKAERILAFRGKHGPFKRIADLRRVKGFGYKTLKKLEPFLDVKGDTTLAGASP